MIELDELGIMFETAGLILDCQILKKIFRSNSQIGGFSSIEIEDFARLMCEKRVENRFKRLIKDIRRRYALGD